MLRHKCEKPFPTFVLEPELKEYAAVAQDEAADRCIAFDRCEVPALESLGMVNERGKYAYIDRC